MAENEKGNIDHGYSTGMISVVAVIIISIILYLGAPAIWCYPSLSSYKVGYGPPPSRLILEMCQPVGWLYRNSNLYRKYIRWQFIRIYGGDPFKES